MNPHSFTLTLLLVIAFGLPLQARASTATNASEERYSFFDAVKKIVERSTVVGTQQANVDGTIARTLPSQLALLPTVTGVVRYTRQNQAGLSADNSGVEGKADLNLFRFGADISGMRAATREVEAQELSLQDAIIKTESEAVRALVAAIQSAMEVQVQERIVKVKEDAVRVARERYSKGLTAAQEVSKFVVDAENAKAQWKDAEISLVSANTDLEALLGTAAVQIEWPFKATITQEAGKIVDSNEPKLQLRPDWQSAEKRVSAAESRKNQAWGQIFPSLDLSFSAGYYRNTVPESFDSPEGSFTGPRWAGSVMLTVPLFDKLANYGNFKEQVYKKAAAELELEKIRRQSKAEWESAKGAVAISTKTAKDRDSTLEISRKLYQDNLLRFQKGLVTANELNIDQERLYSSELLAVRGWGQVYSNIARFCHANGVRLGPCLGK